MALDAQILAFCEQYSLKADAKAAAEHVGIATNLAAAQGHRWLQKLEVQEFLKTITKSAAEKLGITHEWVLQQLLDLHAKCSRPVPVYDRRGRQVFHEDPETGLKIAAYTMYDGRTAVKAAELIARHLKMLTDKLEVGDPSKAPPAKFEPLTAEEASRQWEAICKGT